MGVNSAVRDKRCAGLFDAEGEIGLVGHRGVTGNLGAEVVNGARRRRQKAHGGVEESWSYRQIRRS
jgi:hypothetical protein